MGSDGNKINDGTGFPPSEPALCVNGCGFLGTAATMNLCSKCYRDLRVEEEQAVSAKSAVEKLVLPQNNFVVVDDYVGTTSSSVSVTDTESSASSKASNDSACYPKVANRCSSCNKKVGVLGFQCRCGSTFCGLHRYPEKHECSFDFKAVGRDAIAKANPVVKADKLVDKI